MARKPPNDPKGGHVRLYWDMIDSMAWRCLGASSKELYVAMRRSLKGSNNGNISATLGDLKHYGIRSSATLAKGLRELKTLGFIAPTRLGGIAWGTKVCTLYRFTDIASSEFPKLQIAAVGATDEWRKFTSLADASQALKQAHANARRPKQGSTDGTTQFDVGLQKLNDVASKSERSSSKFNSDSEAVANSLVQKLKQTSKGKTAAKPHVA